MTTCENNWSKTGLSSLMFNNRIFGKEFESTHVKMGEKTGSYHIEDDYDFLKRYGRSVKRFGFIHCILERQQNIGPVTVDVDISRVVKKDQTCLYTEKKILTLARSFQRTFKNILINIPNSEFLDCFVLEKPGYEKDGRFKNGFHLHFPHIWLTSEEKKHIYNLVKTKTKISIDTNVSNWFVYGSKKSVEAKPYLVSYIIEEKRKHVNNTFCVEELINLLSIRMRPHIKVSKFKISLVQPEKRQPVFITTEDGVFPCKIVEEEELRFYTDQLLNNTADEYSSWRSVGCALFNTSHGKEYGLEIWHKFSEKSYKYEENVCNNFWENLIGKSNASTLGTIIWFAKKKKKYKRY